MPFHGIAPKSYYEHITPYAFSGAAHRMAEREDRISRGTTVVSSDEYNPTMLLRRPSDGVGGVSLEPGTAMKVVDYRGGWHKLETLGAEKVRGWVSLDRGPILRPQLSTPRIDKNYVEFDRIDGRSFTGPVKVTDVSQGYLGDCYLAAALGALAHSAPGVIRDAIRNGKRDGTYEVAIDKIGKNGQNYGTRDLILDNWFPTKNDHMLYMNGGRRERARNHIDEFEDFDRPLWPSILEKAFATLAGGYRELDKGGVPGDVFHALTGNQPTSYEFTHRSKTQTKAAMDALKRALRAGDPITAETKDHFVTDGLYKNHTYIPVGYSKKHVVLRNPHDTRKAMTISYEDFAKSFQTITIAELD